MTAPIAAKQDLDRRLGTLLAPLASLRGSMPVRRAVTPAGAACFSAARTLGSLLETLKLGKPGG